MGKPKTNTGYISWPSPSFGLDESKYGTWVFAFWLAEYSEPVDIGLYIVPDLKADIGHHLQDPFIHCEGPDYTIALPEPNCVYNATAVYPLARRPQYTEPLDPDAIHRGNYLRYTMDAGAPVLAAVCLGSVPFTYQQHSVPWVADIKDVTRRGRRLVGAISTLYGGRAAHLVTYVDGTE